MSSTEPLMPARYASRAALTGIANGAISAVCAALGLPLLVAVLGLERYGEWAVLGTFIITGAALDLGLSRAIVITCAGQPEARVRECATAAALIAGSLGLLATGCILLLALASGNFLGFSPTGLSGTVIAGGCAVLVIGMLNGVMRALLESQMAVHWVNVGYLAQTLLYYGLSLLAAYLHPPAVVAAVVSALAIVAMMHFGWLVRAGLWRPVWPRAMTLRDIGRVVRQSYLLAVPPALLPPLAALLVLGAAADHAGFGVYDIAFRVATLASTLLASIAVPMLAAAARAQAGGMGTGRLHDEVRRYLAVGWALFLAGMLTFTLVGPWLLSAMFPAAGGAVFPVALLLLTGMGAISASEAVIRAILGSQDARPVLVARLLMLGVVLSVGAVLLHRVGITAFAAVYAIAGVLSAALVLFAWFKRRRVAA